LPTLKKKTRPSAGLFYAHFGFAVGRKTDTARKTAQYTKENHRGDRQRDQSRPKLEIVSDTFWHIETETADLSQFHVFVSAR